MAVYQYSLNHKVRWVTWNETLSSAFYSETKNVGQALWTGGGRLVSAHS